MLHAKCITVDGRYSVVGSYNVDAYGGKHNLEVGLGAFDHARQHLLNVRCHAVLEIPRMRPRLTKQH